MSDTVQMKHAVGAIVAEMRFAGLNHEQQLRVLAITLGSAVAMFGANAPESVFEELLEVAVEKVRQQARLARVDIRSGAVG